MSNQYSYEFDAADNNQYHKYRYMIEVSGTSVHLYYGKLIRSELKYDYEKIVSFNLKDAENIGEAMRSIAKFFGEGPNVDT